MKLKINLEKVSLKTKLFFLFFVVLGFVYLLATIANNIWFGFPLVILGSALLVIFLDRKIISRIRSLTFFLKNLDAKSENLFACLPEKSPDELGELAQEIEQFVSEVKAALAPINEGLEQFLVAMDVFEKVSKNITETVIESSAQVKEAAFSAKQVNSNAASISTSVEESNENINSVAASIEEISTAITEIAKSTESAAEITQKAQQRSQQTKETVNKLGAAAKEIGAVIDTIVEIAEQTNLLALNATIEAARAGESGRGFAVVAKEVKDLSHQTAAATGNIRHKIESIQNSTDTTVLDINQISKVIDDINNIVHTIAASVTQQTHTNHLIAKNIDETALGSEQVANSVANILIDMQNITERIDKVCLSFVSTAEGILHIEDNVKDLSSMVKGFKPLLNKFS